MRRSFRLLTCGTLLNLFAVAPIGRAQSEASAPAEPAAPVESRVDTTAPGANVTSGPGAGLPTSRSRLRWDYDGESDLNRLGPALLNPWAAQDAMSPFGAAFPLFGFVPSSPGTAGATWSARDMRSAYPDTMGYSLSRPMDWRSPGLHPRANDLSQPPANWELGLTPLGMLAGDVAPGAAGGGLSLPWGGRPAPSRAGRLPYVIPPLAWAAAGYEGEPYGTGADFGRHPLDLSPLPGLEVGSGAVPGWLSADLPSAAGAPAGAGEAAGHAVQPPQFSPLAASGAAPARDMTATDLILADAAMTRGDFDSAQQIYRRVLLLDRSNVSARFSRAIALFAGGSYDEAAVEIHTAFQAAAASPPAIRLRNVILDATVLEERRQGLTTLIGRTPTCERLLLHAYVQASCGRATAALDDLQQAGALDPKTMDLPAVRAWRAVLERQVVGE